MVRGYKEGESRYDLLGLKYNNTARGRESETEAKNWNPGRELGKGVGELVALCEHKHAHNQPRIHRR